MEEELLRLEHIQKHFGDNHVLKDISFSAKRGEFITFLGPSGCGKTTMLRIISGLLAPDSGAVFLNGQDVTKLPPDKRNVNTVFQNYALFPHMNVEKNVAYGLKIRGVPKQERKRRVREMLSLVKLDGFEKKMPDTLSGGQKQRVAIARAAINNPSVLLLDEPLGALDLQLRKYLQSELKRIQQQLGITFIYITHDQEEAMNMSDRIYIMSDGKFEQTGTPREVYDTPKTSFVAKFVGMSNLLETEVVSQTGTDAAVSFEGVLFHVQTPYSIRSHKKVTLSVRSEKLWMRYEPCEPAIEATILENTYTNGIIKVKLETPGSNILTAVAQSGSAFLEVGNKVYAGFDPDGAVVVDIQEETL